MSNALLGDLPPPPPFSLFSGDPPYVAASIAIILFGIAASAAVIWMIARGSRTRVPNPPASTKPD